MVTMGVNLPLKRVDQNVYLADHHTCCFPVHRDFSSASQGEDCRPAQLHPQLDHDVRSKRMSGLHQSHLKKIKNKKKLGFIRKTWVIRCNMDCIVLRFSSTWHGFDGGCVCVCDSILVRAAASVDHDGNGMSMNMIGNIKNSSSHVYNNPLIF